MDAPVTDAFASYRMTKLMKTRVLLVSIVPPRNDCGVRLVEPCSRNGTTASIAAGRTLSRLVSGHERSLRSQIDAADSEPALPRALRRMRSGLLYQRRDAGDPRPASE